MQAMAEHLGAECVPSNTGASGDEEFIYSQTPNYMAPFWYVDPSPRHGQCEIPPAQGATFSCASSYASARRFCPCERWPPPPPPISINRAFDTSECAERPFLG